MNEWLVDRWMDRQVDESVNPFRTISLPFKFLAAFTFQKRIGIYYLNCGVIKRPSKMMMGQTLFLSMCLTTDLETFILSNYY